MPRIFGSITHAGTDSFGRSFFTFEADSPAAENPLAVLGGLGLALIFAPVLVGALVGIFHWNWDLGRDGLLGPYFKALWVTGVGPVLVLFVWLLPRVLWIPLLTVGVLCTFVFGPALADTAKYKVHPEQTSAARAETGSLRAHQWVAHCVLATELRDYDFVFHGPCTRHNLKYNTFAAVVLSAGDVSLLRKHDGSVACNQSDGYSGQFGVSYSVNNHLVDPAAIGFCTVAVEENNQPAASATPLIVQDRYGQQVASVNVRIPK